MTDYAIMDGSWTGVSRAIIVDGTLSISEIGDDITGDADGQQYVEEDATGDYRLAFTYFASVTGQCSLRPGTVTVTINAGGRTGGRYSGKARLQNRQQRHIIRKDARINESGSGVFIGDVTLTALCSAISGTGSVITVTCTGHPFVTGDSVTIAGVTEANFNATATITVVDENTFTYSGTGTGTGSTTTEITAAITI